MNTKHCPAVGGVDARERRSPPTEYPSFENYCFGGGVAEQVMLGDQATYCLSGAHGGCPRWKVAQRSRQAAGLPTGTPIPHFTSAEEAWNAAAPVAGLGLGDFSPVDALELEGDEDGAEPRRRWAWIGAGVMFMTIFACAGMIAAYAGWQYINRNAPVGQAALAQVAPLQPGVPNPTATQPFVVIIATPPGQAPVQGGQLVQGTPVTLVAPIAVTAPEGNPGADAVLLPPAVTPTPILIDPMAAPVESANPAAIDPNSPPVNVDLLVPTRRPTPVFDLPTSTPDAGTATPTPTNTPLPLGTPSVIFGPEQSALEKDQCTLVKWNVQNVREVYYENLPVSGIGQKEECVGTNSQVVSLMVIFGDGQSQVFTSTLAYLPPTPTPTATPRFTEEPVFTPTWTPEPPTATPTPNIRYATSLAPVAGSSINCAPGAGCEIGLLVGNSGDAIDNLAVNLVASGGWPAQLCRPDGVCGGSEIPLNSVGPSNTAFVTLRVTVPADAAAGSSQEYGIEAFSLGANRTISSGVTRVTVTVTGTVP